MAAVQREQAPKATVILGESGSGKTHALAWTRHELQTSGGFFFYMKLVTGQDFWTSAVSSIVDSCTGGTRAVGSSCCASWTNSRAARGSAVRRTPQYSAAIT